MAGNFLWWLGGTAVLLGILGLIGLLVLWVNQKLDDRDRKRRD